MSSESDEPDIDDDEFWKEFKEDVPVVNDSLFNTEEEFFRKMTLTDTNPKKFFFRALT